MTASFAAPGLPINTSLDMMQSAQNPLLAGGITKKSTLDAKDLAKIDEASKQFEGMFMSEMIKPMFDGLQTNGMFDGGKGEEVFRGMMIQEYGKLLSQHGGVGLASSIKDQMIKIQEQANNAHAKL